MSEAAASGSDPQAGRLSASIPDDRDGWFPPDPSEVTAFFVVVYTPPPSCCSCGRESRELLALAPGLGLCYTCREVVSELHHARHSGEYARWRGLRRKAGVARG